MATRGAIPPLLSVAALVLIVGWLASSRQPSVPPPPASPRYSIDLNTASQRELESLPGVGPKMAKAIIDSRRELGPFGMLADLDRVPGVGPATIERLSDLLRIGPRSGEPSLERGPGGEQDVGTVLE